MSESHEAQPAMVGPDPTDVLERRALGVVVAALLALSTVLTASGRERVVGWSQIVVQAFTAEPAQSLFHIGVNKLTPSKDVQPDGLLASIGCPWRQSSKSCWPRMPVPPRTVSTLICCWR